MSLLIQSVLNKRFIFLRVLKADSSLGSHYYSFLGEIFIANDNIMVGTCAKRSHGVTESKKAGGLILVFDNSLISTKFNGGHIRKIVLNGVLTLHYTPSSHLNDTSMLIKFPTHEISGDIVKIIPSHTTIP